VYQIREMREFIEGSTRELKILERDLKRRHVIGSELIREMDRHVQLLQEMMTVFFAKQEKLFKALDKKTDRYDLRFPIRLEEKVKRKDLKGIDLGSTRL